MSTPPNRFQPGHPRHPPAHDERGLHAPVRKAQRELAFIIDDMVDIRDIVARVHLLAQGIDPATRASVDPALQFAASKYILERRFGSTPQVIELTARVAAVGVNVQAPLASLSDGDLESLERMLGQAGIVAALPAGEEDA